MIADLRTLETLEVYDDTRRAGTLTRTERGSDFTYDDAYRRDEIARNGIGVAFHLPLHQPGYITSGTNLHTFFAGLLPEGLRLKALRTMLKTSEDDLFTMLAALGSNCIGNIYVRGIDVQTEPLEMHSPQDVSFLELFQASINNSNQSQRERDPGIPGVMPKISASMISFPVNVKKKQKQYLLKLGSKEHPNLIENEHFFMTMAADCGIRVAPTKIVYDRDGQSGLLVERFDRTYDASTETTSRLHQEDACQFLNRYPQDKYRVGLREICDAIVRYSTMPLVDIRALIELYLFSYLVGNGDLHAKNISLLQTQTRDEVQLSPAYDVVSTLPYGDRKMALRMNGRDENFSQKDFVVFAALFGVREKAIVSTIEKIIDRSASWVSRFSECGVPKKKVRDLEKTFSERAAHLVR